MPVYRRRSATQIAKLNATSIDGYFGEGTRCFFIRGTILSDSQVDGEYRTLQIQRPGNSIEIEAFDGEWATVSIATRTGNRTGDNIQARVRLRESDLRSIGFDVERILAGYGAFEEPVEQEPVTSEFVPWPVTTNGASTNGASTNGATNGHTNGYVAPPAPPPPARQFQPTIERIVEPEPEPPPAAAVEPEPEPVVAAVEDAKPTIEGVVIGETSKPVNESRVLFSNANASLVDGKLILEIGASVVAVALPVVLYFVRSLFTKKDGR